MKMTDLFIRRPILSIVISLLILFVGMRALISLPLRQLPQMINTVITIRTTYPGAPPDLIQGFITTPLERAVSSVDGVDYITSTSIQSVSTIVVNVKLNRDPGQAMTDVLTKIQQVKAQLPQEANDPVIVKQGESQPVVSMAFVSATLPRTALYDYITRVVQPMLSTVSGIASSDPGGSGAFAMRVWLDPSRMMARGVTAEDVANAIRANNVQAAPGRTKSYFTTKTVTTNTGLTGVEQFRDMVVKSSGGVLIRLRDVADVALDSQDSNSDSTVDSKNSVVLPVSQTPDGNPIEIAKGVKELFPEIQRTLPPGAEFFLASDASRYIQQSINEVIKALLGAVATVIVVIFLTLGAPRTLLIPIATIPLSIIGVAILALPLGFSLNLLTMLAMVLAIGLVVDDAIVVMENITRHIEEGHSPYDAALIGAREIVGPVISMTITLAAVYAPIGFLGGLTGSLFREFSFSLAGSVIISGVVALTLSPMMCSRFLAPAGAAGRVEKAVSRTFNRIRDAYSRRLETALEYRSVVGLFAVAVFASIVFMFQHSRSELAPPEDQNLISISTRGPEFANVDYMRAYAPKFDDLIRPLPEVFHWGVNSGGDRPNTGSGVIRLKDWQFRDRSTMEIGAYLQREINKFDGVTGFVSLPSPLPTPGGLFGGPPVQMVVANQGQYEDLFNAMEQIKVAARESGMFLALDSTLNFNSPVARVNIDRAKANDLGINMDSISKTLATLVGENYVNRFSLEGRSYQVIPQVPRAMRLNAEALTQFYVRTSTGQMIPLSTVATVSSGVQPNALTRYNQMNSTTFQATPAPGIAMGQAVAFLNEQAAKLPQGFTSAFLGDSRQFVQEGNQLVLTFGFSVLVIFLVLAAQFESMRDALVILVSVPMSICGALFPIFFGLTTMNIYTQIGMVTLIGLISKHGILMVAFAREQQRDRGLDRRAAIAEAARIRLRPILMTTAAMVAGLLPLIIATGPGAASRVSLGIVVVSGMSIGTLFTLFVLPVVYTWLATDHRAVARAARAREPNLVPG